LSSKWSMLTWAFCYVWCMPIALWSSQDARIKLELELFGRWKMEDEDVKIMFDGGSEGEC